MQQGLSINFAKAVGDNFPSDSPSICNCLRNFNVRGQKHFDSTCSSHSSEKLHIQFRVPARLEDDVQHGARYPRQTRRQRTSLSSLSPPDQKTTYSTESVYLHQTRRQRTALSQVSPPDQKTTYSTEPGIPARPEDKVQH